MKKLLLPLILLAFAFGANAADKQKRDTVVYVVEIHCQGCVDKIQNNIAFEKGVKNMRINKETQEVWLVFDPTKTSDEKLRTAFAKIGKPVKMKKNKPTE